MKREDIIRLSEDFLLSKNIPTHKLISQVYGHGEISLTGLLADFALSLPQKDHEPTEPTMSQPMEQEGMSAEEWLRKGYYLDNSDTMATRVNPKTTYGEICDLMEQYAASRIEKKPKVSAWNWIKKNRPNIYSKLSNGYKHPVSKPTLIYLMEQYAKTNKSK